MIYPCISNCSQCGKAMPQFRSTKKFCSSRCRQKSYRVINGLPLTWIPDPTKRKALIGAVLPSNLDKGKSGDQFTSQTMETKHGLRRVYINQVTSEVHVFAIQDGKEILIK